MLLRYLRFPPTGRVLQSALVAVSGFVPCVNSLMDAEPGLPAEGLPALGTLVRFLSRMDSQVQPKSGPLAERFAALGTFVGLLPCVSPRVYDEL